MAILVLRTKNNIHMLSFWTSLLSGIPASSDQSSDYLFIRGQWLSDNLYGKQNTPQVCKN